MNTIPLSRASLVRSLLPAVLGTLLIVGQSITAAEPGQGIKVVAIAHKDRPMHYTTPRPFYPLQARMARASGRGTIRISFGKDGKPTGAAMVESTRSAILDDSTTRFAYKYWRSTPGNPSTLELHVVYALQ